MMVEGRQDRQRLGCERSGRWIFCVSRKMLAEECQGKETEVREIEQRGEGVWRML
jgi:hypothetical protein